MWRWIHKVDTEVCVCVCVWWWLISGHKGSWGTEANEAAWKLLATLVAVAQSRSQWWLDGWMEKAVVWRGQIKWIRSRSKTQTLTQKTDQHFVNVSSHRSREELWKTSTIRRYLDSSTCAFWLAAAWRTPNWGRICSGEPCAHLSWKPRRSGDVARTETSKNVVFTCVNAVFIHAPALSLGEFRTAGGWFYCLWSSGGFSFQELGEDQTRLGRAAGKVALGWTGCQERRCWDVGADASAWVSCASWEATLRF